jgi:hypothetical protein
MVSSRLGTLYGEQSLQRDDELLRLLAVPTTQWLSQLVLQIEHSDHGLIDDGGAGVRETQLHGSGVGWMLAALDLPVAVEGADEL